MSPGYAASPEDHADRRWPRAGRRQPVPADRGVCNFYLIEDGGKLVLVDAGAPRDWDLLVRTLATLGRQLDSLDAVLVTHAHSDHIGLAERARTAAAAPVWIHQADAAVARGAKLGGNDGTARSYLLRVEFYRTLVSLVRRGRPG